MSLDPPTAPRSHAGALAHWLTRLAAELGPGPRAMAPLPVYAVGRDDLAAGGLLAHARLVAWRSLVLDAAGEIAALDLVPPREPADDWALGALTRGPAARAVRATLPAAADHAAEGDELRLLITAAPPFEAHWLHGPTRDVLVPTRDGADGLVAGAGYTPAQVLAVLQPEARRDQAGERAESG